MPGNSSLTDFAEESKGTKCTHCTVYFSQRNNYCSHLLYYTYYSKLIVGQKINPYCLQQHAKVHGAILWDSCGIKFTENSFIYESLTLTFLLSFHPHCISIQILILHFKSSSSNPLGPLLASALYRQTILISHRGVTFHLLINFLYGTVSQDVVIYFFMILTHLAPLFICQSIFVDFTETYA